MDMMQLGFVLGLDNVAVALALGPLALSARRAAPRCWRCCSARPRR
jgi:hypothetical protein